MAKIPEKKFGVWQNFREVLPHHNFFFFFAIQLPKVSEKWSNFGKIVSRIDRIRGYGDFYHYHLLATGKIDAVIESDVNILDIAALSIIISESGGVFTDLNGKKPDLNIRSTLAANPILYPEIKSHLDGHS